MVVEHGRDGRGTRREGDLWRLSCRLREPAVQIEFGGVALHGAEDVFDVLPEFELSAEAGVAEGLRLGSTSSRCTPAAKEGCLYLFLIDLTSTSAMFLLGRTREVAMINPVISSQALRA